MPWSLIAPIVLFIALAWPGRPQASDQPAPATESESAAVSAYAQEQAAFARFRTELRSALRSGDARAVLPLVTLPLTVNLGRDGSIALRTETAFLRHFDRYLTPDWRQAIIDGDDSDDIFRASIPLAYGAAWVRQMPTDPPIFKLWIVNTPGNDRVVSDRTIELACETTRTRFVIERAGDALELRFAARTRPDERHTWDGGSDESGGTGDCSASAWAFEHEGRRIEIAEPGCRDDTPPEYARASVVDSAAGTAESWCY